MKKKAYIFLMDGIFAVVILIIGFIIISSNKPGMQTTASLEQVSENLVDIFSTVKINDLCTNCHCSNKKLTEYCNQGHIRNKDQTIFDYIGELYYINNKEKARDMFQNITEDLYRKDLFGVELKIDDEIVFSTNKDGVTKNLISRKKLIFGFYEVSSTGIINFWGPFKVEVNMWEK